MEIRRSSALKKFKKEIGQANHFLITILIGLDGVKKGEIHKNDEFDAAWNPKNIEASVLRSRVFALKSAMAWIVDCLDMYLRLLNRKPRLLSEEDSRLFDSTKQSVYKKYEIIKQYSQDKMNNAAVDLLICWRNKMVHFDADNDILPDSKKTFQSEDLKDEWISRCHLDIQQMLDRFNKNETPTFKEVAFLTRKTISFVENIDKILLQQKDFMELLDETICMKLKEDHNSFMGIFQKKEERRKLKLIHFIQTCGFSTETILETEQKYLDKICSMTYEEIKEKVQEGSFL